MSTSPAFAQQAPAFNFSLQLPGEDGGQSGMSGNWLYTMRVDKCDGEVDRVERVRRTRGGGFGLRFNFSNECASDEETTDEHVQ